MGTLRTEAVVGVTCWELKSHLFKALVLSIFTHGTEIWGVDLKSSHWKVFETYRGVIARRRNKNKKKKKNNNNNNQW
jgi:hypothetical protein